MKHVEIARKYIGIKEIGSTQEIADALSKEYQKGVIEREIIYEKIKGNYAEIYQPNYSLSVYYIPAVRSF